MPTSLVSTGVQFPDNSIQTTAATAGGLNLVTTVAGTAASSIYVDSGFTSTYDYYDIIIAGRTSNSATLGVRLAFGGTIVSSSTYEAKLIANNSITAQSGSNFIDFGFFGVDNTANNFQFTFRVVNPTLTTTYKVVDFSGCAYRSGSVFLYSGGGTTYSTTDALTGIQFFPSAGTITATARLYGYAK